MKKSIKITLSAVAVGAIVVGGSAFVQKDNNDLHAESEPKNVVHADSQPEDVAQTDTQSEAKSDEDYDVIKTDTTTVQLKKEKMSQEHEDAQKMIDEQNEREGITENLIVADTEDDVVTHDGNTFIRNAHVTTSSLVDAEKDDEIEMGQEDYQRLFGEIIKDVDGIEYDGPENEDFQRVITFASQLYLQDTVKEDDERYQKMLKIMEKLDDQFNGSNAYEYNIEQ